MTVSTSGRLTWLADVVRAAGITVLETDGWKARGHADFIEARGVMAHHTACGPTGNAPSLPTEINGRPDLSGPLYNLELARDGAVYTVAAGVAWHAGTGVWSNWLPTDMGNWYAIGIGAESQGTVDDWTAAQRNVYPRLVACLLAAIGQGADRLVAHREYDPVYKIDPSFWNMADFRAQVAGLLKGGGRMDASAPIPFAASSRDYFNRLYPGLGDEIAANFPMGGNAPFDAAEGYGLESARAAVLVGVHNAAQIAAARADVAALAQLVKTLCAAQPCTAPPKTGA